MSNGETSQPPEVWLPVPDFEGYYEVSNLGRLRRAMSAPAASGTRPGRMLTPVMDGRYAVVTLSRAGEVATYRLHRLVLIAFCGREPFAGAHAAHNNGIASDCRLTNLRWATPVENQADVERHGHRVFGTAVHNAVLNEDGVRQIQQRILSGERNRPIAEDFGVSISTIHLIRHKRIWRHVQ